MTIDLLVKIYNQWGNQNKIHPLHSADEELWNPNLNGTQKDWLKRFIKVWHRMQDVEDQRHIKKSMNEYIERLKYADWFYEHSDDHMTWHMGYLEFKKLKEMARMLDRNYVYWNYYCKNNDLKQTTLLGGNS